MSSNPSSSQQGDSSRSLAVSAQNVGKTYRIVHNKANHSTMGEALLHRLRNPFERSDFEIFEALREVSFTVECGEVVGIVGRNGAGKSTLLKILSQITSPTSGQIDLYGRVGSLLEVGTGFHPELTGRENIYLNGAILGMKKREIKQQFDAIVDFAGVEQFLDTPVKRYSSGMYVRLAFAVAAHLNPEILIIDEVLAVGDADFQQKCLNKMQDVAQQGRTILFVSHNMVAVRALCSRVIVLDHGRVTFDGESTEGIRRYLAASPTSGESEVAVYNFSDRPSPYIVNKTFIQGVKLLDKAGVPSASIEMGETLTVEVEVEGLDEFPSHHCGVMLKLASGELISLWCTDMQPIDIPEGRRSRERFVLHLPKLMLIPGTYYLEIKLWQEYNSYVTKLDRVSGIAFQIQRADLLRTGYSFDDKDGLVVFPAHWEVRPADSQVITRPHEEYPVANNMKSTGDILQSVPER